MIQVLLGLGVKLLATFRFDYEYDFLETFRFDYEYELD